MSTIRSVLAAHNLEIADSRIELLARYGELLWDWNTRLNLTRHLDWEKFVGRDVTDSRQLASCLQADESVLDVGSGGGVPGVLLAILRPDLNLTLCESVHKKAAALSDIVSRLELPCAVVASRAEEVLTRRKFDTLVARAVGSMARLLRCVQPHWDRFGRLLLIKGPKWVQERGEARHLGLLRRLELRRLRAYAMAGTESESVVLQFLPKSTA